MSGERSQGHGSSGLHLQTHDMSVAGWMDFDLFIYLFIVFISYLISTLPVQKLTFCRNILISALE